MKLVKENSSWALKRIILLEKALDQRISTIFEKDYDPKVGYPCIFTKRIERDLTEYLLDKLLEYCMENLRTGQKRKSSSGAEALTPKTCYKREPLKT